MDEAVMRQHVGLYVNEYSLDLGVTGTAAVKRLFEEAEQRDIFPHSSSPLFAEA
jgi:1,4-dihydroxy-6-naphthoate synthase